MHTLRSLKEVLKEEKILSQEKIKQIVFNNITHIQKKKRDQLQKDF